ncbi:ATP-dependent nuclease [Bacillus cereus]|uniref:ATP-dependent nuclease n=1 Tax=Bacillus cereus group TaxID=86661 RepID=UPI001C8EBB5A|nr:AAA family ATPase [Bacillus cereus]MBY0015019.1 AAA family ATPase [Bacillus cereus]MDZ4502787.1 AAA family ATPase [Bacillus cereus]
MKIKEVEIKNFRSIKELSIKTGNLVSLVGKNNYGKTAIFEALLVFFRQNKLVEKDIHMFSHEELPEISITFENVEMSNIEWLLGKNYDADYAYENYLNGEVRINLSFSRGSNQFRSKYILDQEGVIIPLTVLDNILPDIKYVSSIRNPEDNTLKKKNSNLSQLMDLLIENNDKNDEIITIQGKQLKVKDIKNELKKSEELKAISLSKELSEKFQKLVGHQALSIEIKVERTDIIHLHETKIKDHDILSASSDENSFDIQTSGTGMQSLLIIAILEAYIKHNTTEQDFILIIEEPEVYLHPSLQRKIVNILKEISSSNQVFISTHSPIVVSQLKSEDLVCIKKESGITEKLDSDSGFIINELGIRPDDIFQHTKILFVEGPDDKKLIRSLIDKLVKSKKINAEKADALQIIDVGGIDTLSFYSNARILDTMNKAHHNHYKFWIMVDSDGNSKEEVQKRIEKSLKEFNNIYNEEDLFILEEYAIESYFIDENILCHLFDDLEQEETRTICEKYFDLYKIGKSEKLKIGKSQFQNKYKPKNFFVGKESIFYEKTWGLNEDEIEILDTIQSKWETSKIDQYIEEIPLEILEKSKINEIIRHIKNIFDRLT